MSSNFHFDHHRREAIVNKQRFSLLSALLLMGLLAGVGVLIKTSTFAAGYPASGLITLNGKAYPGVSVATCNGNPTGKSASNGIYSVSLSSRAYCAKPYGAKSYYVLTPIDVSADRQNQKSYEHQIAAYNCFRKTTSPCPNTTVSASPYHWDRNSDAATNFAYTYTFATAPSLSGTSTSTTNNLNWSGAKTQSGARYYDVYRGTTVYKRVSGTTLSLAVPYTCGKSVSYQVQTIDMNNLGSAKSNVYTANVACPPPPATPRPVAPTPTPVAPAATPVPATPRPATPAPTKTPKPVAVAPKPGVVTPTQPTTAAPADTTAPAAPQGFTAATSSGGNNIVLSWSESTDSSGIKGYNIERSTDQTTWTSLASNITGTIYDDKTVAFDTHYYYRLTAADKPGNISGYALADAVTTAYEQNAGPDDSVLASDDSVASVTIPADAVPSGADCSVVQGEATIDLAKDQAIIAGPYQLLCKDTDGNPIASFTKELVWSYQLGDKLMGYGKPMAVAFDDADKSSQSKSSYDKKKKTISFTQASGTQTIILASKTKGIPFNLIIGILFVIGLFVAVFFFVLRRKQKENYSEYIRSKYYDI